MRVPKCTTALALALTASVGTAFAKEWTRLEERWYTPKESAIPQTVDWSMDTWYQNEDGSWTDVKIPVKFTGDGEGGYSVSNWDEINNSGYGLAEVLDLTCDAVSEINRLSSAASLLDERFKVLSQKLDDTMDDIYARLDKLELEDETTGTKKTLTRKAGGTATKTVYVGNLDPFVPDGKSISKTAKTGSSSGTAGRAQLLGFDTAGIGDFPYRLAGSLAWVGIADMADGHSTEGAVTTTSDGKTAPKIGMKGWFDDWSGSCSPSLAGMMLGTEDENADHRMLSRYGIGYGELHYTKIGSIAGGAGNAGRYLRTSADGAKAEWALPVTKIESGGGIVVETDEKTGAVTLSLDGSSISVESQATSSGSTELMTGRKVTFAAASDSCVTVNLSQGKATNEIVVAIGCYYK